MNFDELNRLKYTGYLYTVSMFDVFRKDAYSSIKNNRLDNCLEIHYCISGEEKMRINDEVRLFSPDTIRVLPPNNKTNDDVQIKTTKKSKFIVIGYITMDPFVTHPVLIDAKNKPKIKDLFEKLLHIWDGKYEGYFFEGSSVFYLLLKELKGLMSQGFSNSGYIEKQLSPAVRYIHEHYTEKDMDFSGLPEMCGLKNNYFHKIFQRRYNTTPSKYVTTLRMSLATDLLFDGQFSISEIAEKTGYETTTYFGRVFKKYYGIPPSKYTKKSLEYSEYL